jgi:xanthine dehydrogenase/oxidase
LDLQLFSNAGYSYDLSEPVMGRALTHCDCVYNWPALRVTGTLCRTNQPSHTAFRGFGGPQGVFVTETVMEHLATAAHINIDELRTINMYHTGDETHFGTTLEQFNVPELWDKVKESSQYEERLLKVNEFNRSNKWRKRGIYLLGTKYGINYTAKFMNQASALVHIYTDGTVLVSHGGMEMGQGVHTKMIQIVARALNISHTKVHISETATNTIANATATAGSMTTDMYGMALLNACEQLNERLNPVREKMPNASWEEIINSAFFSRIILSAHGTYIVPTERCGYDFSKKVIHHNSERGMPFNYFTQGAVCCEVEVDCLTGDNKIIRTDIAMDVGQSINPAIDIGQIEGAFIQGYGWCTMEELIWGDTQHPWVRQGNLFTQGPGTYKIPSFNDVPQDFRVYLADKSNKRAVHSSKGIGEPPFLLSMAAFFAIKNAIKAARSESNASDMYFQLNLPASSERIRMACTDRFVSQTVSTDVESFQPKGSW